MLKTKPRFLASVRDTSEALRAVALGAEVVDLKEPRAGALGAVPEDEQRRVVAALRAMAACPTISATVGDLPFEAMTIADAIERTAATGVDIVKFGVFAAGPAAVAGFAALDARLRQAPLRVRIVALLLAERLRDIDDAVVLAVQALRVQGVAGVMLDTERKGGAALPEVFAPDELARFVDAVHAASGFAGLAGALRAEHIAPLVATGADLLGFRGALCAQDRAGALDPRAFVHVRDQLFAARAARKALASASNTSAVATAGERAAISG